MKYNLLPLNELHTFTQMTSIIARIFNPLFLSQQLFAGYFDDDYVRELSDTHMITHM